MQESDLPDAGSEIHPTTGLITASSNGHVIAPSLYKVWAACSSGESPLVSSHFSLTPKTRWLKSPADGGVTLVTSTPWCLLAQVDTSCDNFASIRKRIGLDRWLLLLPLLLAREVRVRGLQIPIGRLSRFLRLFAHQSHSPSRDFADSGGPPKIAGCCRRRT
jgi:hypothetical protein